jgi:hypothetical protein
MTSSLLRKSVFAFALAGVGLMLYAADAQQPRPAAAPGAAAQPSTADLPHPIRAKQLLGSRINLANKTEMGTVDDIVLGDAGDVEYLIVKRDDNKLVSVPWSAAMWANDYKTATVNITPEQYKVIPTYNATTYPQYFTPTYRTETYKYYGLTPGQLRRLNRRLP